METIQSTLPAVGGEHVAGDRGHVQSALPLAKGMSLSHWQQMVRCNPLLDHRTTPTLPSEADVVIIGSGISGALAAFSLLHSNTPPRSIVMLEARHCKPDQWRGYSTYEQLFGSEEALKILANERKTWQALVDFVRQHNVDCDLWCGQTLDVLMEEQVVKRAAETFAAFKAAGGDVSGIKVTTDSARAEEISRIANAKAVYAWDASTLQPWKLVAFVIQKCLDAGLILQTWTPATSVTGQDNDWIVSTERGSISTPTVIHATNAFASALLPEILSAITPMPHMCNRVYPPSAFSGSKALQNSYAVLYNDGMYSVNPRSTSDGAVLFGGAPPSINKLKAYVAMDKTRHTDDSLVDFEPITEDVRRLCSEGFQWASTDYGSDIRYDYSWSGIIGYSGDEVPFVGAVPGKKGQWMSCGHNGHGMARTFTCSPALVKMIQGASWDEVNLPDCFQVTEERLRRISKRG